MKLLLVCLLAITIGVTNAVPSFGEQGTYVDNVKFIQYLDENTALEEVKNGNLDLYYYRISSDRLETSKAREGLKVFESTGGSYSILLNPAVSETFNPFSINEVRFAINYLVDRKLIVNELMGGYGTTMISNYGPFDPDYLTILDQLESFHFRYNPSLAESIISQSLKDAGAKKIDKKWFFDGNPIEIIIFIRSDDPVRKSIGEILASEFKRIGFSVKKDYGDLNKAFVIVYGSNPSDVKWHLYTEGWGGRSAFVRYDSVGLGQMYSPWFSSMPGFNDPSYWNYQNDYLDSITQKIYTGNFSSAEERTKLIQEATVEGVKESVRIFLASKIDQYVVNDDVNGVINDFGAGVPSRFTPINSRSDSDSLVIGVKQIYQGAWNPVMGLSDSYSTQIWNTLNDPAIFKHPYTGENFPIRSTWEVVTAGPDGKLEVPDDVIIWEPALQKWKNVEPGTMATSKVTVDLKFSNWHHGQPMDINDVLHSLYFTIEWGSQQLENDKTFDTEYTPRTSQVVNTIIGIKPLDENTIDVYVDYWHFDEAEIADWASMWTSMPWEIFSAMEQTVIDGKASFSRSGAVSKNVNWLSLLVPHDARIIQEYLKEFKESGFVPASLENFEQDSSYYQSRYDASIDWIEKNDHAVISNGPFYLDRYSPESRTISINAFVDESYPFDAGSWAEFEGVKFPTIVGIDMPDIVSRGQSISIPISTKVTSQINYFFTNSNGDTVSSGIQNVDDDHIVLTLSEEETQLLSIGANDFKIFAISDTVLRPDVFSTSFLVVDYPIQELPSVEVVDVDSTSQADSNYAIPAVVIIGIIVTIILYYRKRTKRNISMTS
jgi:peptide/nickel transport system substrate-binding protein